jgi:tetratricopeptide (TPR) repeat protein
MIRVYPRDWQLSFRTGETLMQQGRVEEAISFFEHSVQLAPADQYYPYQGLASAYYQLDQYERAANVLERWLLLHPDDPNVKPIYDELVQSLQAGGTPRPDTASQPPSPPIANDD